MQFYLDKTNILPINADNEIEINSLTLATLPLSTEVFKFSSVNANTKIIAAYKYDFPSNDARIEVGDWILNTYAKVDKLSGGQSKIITKIYDSVLELGTVTIIGAGASRTATASLGTPFQSSDASSDITLASYLKTPKGLYQIIGYTSPTVVTIKTPTTYSNEAAVAFRKIVPIYEMDSGAIISSDYDLYQLTSTNSYVNLLIADEVYAIYFANTSRTSDTIISMVYNGTTRCSNFISPYKIYNNTSNLDELWKRTLIGGSSYKLEPFYGADIVEAPNYVSTVLAGTAPYTATSSSVCTGVNADMADGYHFDQDLRISATPSFASGDIQLGTLNPAYGAPQIWNKSTNAFCRLGSSTLWGDASDIPAIGFLAHGLNYADSPVDASNQSQAYFFPQSGWGFVNITGGTSIITGTFNAVSGQLAFRDNSNNITFLFNRLTGALDVSSSTTASYFISNVAIGTAPFQCASTTINPNLNAGLLNGQTGSYYAPIDNPTFTTKATSPYFISSVATGTAPFQCASTTNCTNLDADTTDGKHLDQDVLTTSTVQHGAIYTYKGSATAPHSSSVSLIASFPNVDGTWLAMLIDFGGDGSYRNTSFIYSRTSGTEIIYRADSGNNFLTFGFSGTDLRVYNSDTINDISFFYSIVRIYK